MSLLQLQQLSGQLAATASSEGLSRPKRTECVSGRSVRERGGEWHDWYKADLFERLIPNMMEYVADHEVGGSLCMIEHMNDSWAHRIFEETFDYVQQNYVPEGYKFWIHAADRKVTEYGGRRMENYHHPRHLMLNLLSLERILEREGRTSDLMT